MIGATVHDTIRTIIYSGRPMRVLKNKYAVDWEENRQAEIKELTSQGHVPAFYDMERREKSGEEMDFKERMDAMPLLMGQGAGAVNEVMPAKQIMDEMVTGAVEILKRQASTITAVSDMKLTASL